jgi:NAD-dependent deacetylase
VDGLHRAAGSRNVFELHGNIRMSRCQTCGLETETMRALDGWSPGDVPRCGSCGGLIRPSVVWFGEALPAVALRAADDAIRSCDLMLVVGTSGVVQPAASFAVGAKQRGARVIEVNPEATPISGIADVCLRGPAARELPLLLDPTLRRRLSRYTGAG